MNETPRAISPGGRIVLPRSDSPRVSILVPSAAGPALLRACLGSLERHAPRSIPFETIVVLDGAPAEEAAMLDEGVTGVRAATSSVHLGLAGAGNLGRRMARGELLVLLHDDAEVEPGWLEALVETADAHPEAGVVGSLVLFPDGSLQGAGMVLWREGKTSPPWLGPPPAPSAFDRPRAVDYCGTCSLLVRARTWDAIGGLDERFFPAYYVDVDLAMAARSLGQTVLLQPASRARHVSGASFSPIFREFLVARNRVAFKAKWGRALDEHEPRTGEPREALHRALARAEALAERLASRPAPHRAEPAPPGVEEPALREMRSLEQDLALHKDYAKSLEALLEAERNKPLWRILSRRLYFRLLPILDWLRARGARRLIRRGAPSRTE